MTSAFDRFAAADALDYQVFRKTRDAFDLDVTGCRYAQLYEEIGTSGWVSRRVSTAVSSRI